MGFGSEEVAAISFPWKHIFSNYLCVCVWVGGNS